MTHIEYENICRDVYEGKGHEVLNKGKHESGTVMMCSREHFNVKIGEGWQVWPRQECEELR